MSLIILGFKFRNQCVDFHSRCILLISIQNCNRVHQKMVWKVPAQIIDLIHFYLNSTCHCSSLRTIHISSYIFRISYLSVYQYRLFLMIQIDFELFFSHPKPNPLVHLLSLPSPFHRLHFYHLNCYHPRPSHYNLPQTIELVFVPPLFPWWGI